MAAIVPVENEDERLPLLVGFQKISETTNRNTHFIDHGRGIYIYDTDGNEYIEATSSFYVASLGYGCDEEAVRITKLLKYKVPKTYKLKVGFKKKLNIHFKLKKIAKKIASPQATHPTYKYTVTSKSQQGSSSFTYKIKV